MSAILCPRLPPLKHREIEKREKLIRMCFCLALLHLEFIRLGNLDLDFEIRFLDYPVKHEIQKRVLTPAPKSFSEVDFN